MVCYFVFNYAKRRFPIESFRSLFTAPSEYPAVVFIALIVLLKTNVVCLSFSDICTFIFNWFHFVLLLFSHKMYFTSLYMKERESKCEWERARRRRSSGRISFFLFNGKHLTSLHLFNVCMQYISFSLTCFHLTISTLMNAQHRSHSYITFYELYSAFKNIRFLCELFVSLSCRIFFFLFFFIPCSTQDIIYYFYLYEKTQAWKVVQENVK